LQIAHGDLGARHEELKAANADTAELKTALKSSIDRLVAEKEELLDKIVAIRAETVRLELDAQLAAARQRMKSAQQGRRSTSGVLQFLHVD
jgi:predicted nuclease with TOPRIM domain